MERKNTCFIDGNSTFDQFIEYFKTDFIQINRHLMLNPIHLSSSPLLTVNLSTLNIASDKQNQNIYITTEYIHKTLTHII